MRGTEGVRHGRKRSMRITPACAGNRPLTYAYPPWSGDHPRVCGEQQIDVQRQRVQAGSPPRVRGTGLQRRKFKHPMRITPACAGNSFCILFSLYAYRDHPRVCGEQGYSAGDFQHGKGSPPRVRGTEFHTDVQPREKRITPACAGNRTPSRQNAGM